MANSEGDSSTAARSAGRDWSSTVNPRRGRTRRVVIGAVAALSLAVGGVAVTISASGIGFQVDGKSWAAGDSSSPFTMLPAPGATVLGKSWAAADPTPPVTM